MDVCIWVDISVILNNEININWPRDWEILTKENIRSNNVRIKKSIKISFVYILGTKMSRYRHWKVPRRDVHSLSR